MGRFALADVEDFREDEADAGEDEHDARRTLCILFERTAERFAESEPHHREADG